MNKLQNELAKLRGCTDPRETIAICCRVFSITGTTGGAYAGVKDYINSRIRRALLEGAKS
jgi:hypothetical protein